MVDWPLEVSAGPDPAALREGDRGIGRADSAIGGDRVLRIRPPGSGYLPRPPFKSSVAGFPLSSRDFPRLPATSRDFRRLPIFRGAEGLGGPRRCAVEASTACGNVENSRYLWKTTILSPIPQNCA